MKKYILIAISLIIVAFNFLKQPQRQVTYNQDSKIYAFGDSLTFGYGSKKSYPQYLSEKLGVKINNLGINGERTDMALKRLKKTFIKTPANIVILMHGGNDFLQKKSHQKTRNNLEAMIKFLQSKNIQIVFIGIPSSAFDLLSGANKIYTELADQYNLVYDKKTIANLLTDKSLKSDTVHFNSKGYEKIAEKIFLLFKKSN